MGYWPQDSSCSSTPRLASAAVRENEKTKIKHEEYIKLTIHINYVVMLGAELAQW